MADVVRFFQGSVLTTSTNSSIACPVGKDLVCHLTASGVTGTTPSMTIKLQDSGDGTNWVDIPSATFTAVTADGSQRLVVNTVGSCVRAVATITGTTPSFTVDLSAVSR